MTAGSVAVSIAILVAISVAMSVAAPAVAQSTLSRAGPSSQAVRAPAPLAVVDDAQRRVELRAPAQRIVALAPNLVEMAYAAGAGSRLVGVVSYSDFPAAAQRIARVGDANALDLERIVALKPDLVLAWWHGNPPRQIEQLSALGIPVFDSAPATLDDIPGTLDKLGTLFDTQAVAGNAAQRLRARIAGLRAYYAGRPVVSVFYQVWDDPLLTLNGQQIISAAITLCGGRNVFANLPQPVPAISTEAVLAANPQVIVGAEPLSRSSLARDRGREREVHEVQTADGATNPEVAAPESSPRLAGWRKWPTLAAVAHGNLFTLDADTIDRPGPRFIDGAGALCADLELARQHLGLAPAAPALR